MYFLNFSLSALGCPQSKDAEYGASQTADFEASSACRVAGNGLTAYRCYSGLSAGTNIGKTARCNVGKLVLGGSPFRTERLKGSLAVSPLGRIVGGCLPQT